METTWIRFVAVSSTSLRASKGPSVNTVRESRDLAQAPVRGGTELNVSFWHHGCVRGGVRKGKGWGVEGT